MPGSNIGEVAVSLSTHNDSCCCVAKNKFIQWIDGISAVLSFCGLCFGLVYMREETRFETWTDKFVWLNQSSDMMLTAFEYQKDFHETCDSATDMKYQMYIGSTSWTRRRENLPSEKITYNSISVPIQGEGFNPWYMLIFVLYISSLFQGTRCVFNSRDFFVSYKPGSGPDFSRWLEYAITSPLQIVIVADIFSLGNYNLLLTLACLQGALVILGFLLELIMDDIMIQCSEGGGKNDSHQPRNCIELLFVLISSIFFHIVIWYIIINTFLDQVSTSIDCSGIDIEIPPIVTFIIGIQCFFFSTFGLVLCFQAFYVMFCLNCCSSLMNTTENRESLWKTVTIWYSILSVLAKGSLEYGFIFFITTYDINNN